MATTIILFGVLVAAGLLALARWPAHVRCWEVYERALRPWEDPRTERPRRSHP